MRAYSKRISTGVVLAAGCGVRLAGAECPGLSKLLIPVQEKPLIWHSIRGLELAGCRRIIVVLGHSADGVREAVARAYSGGARIEFVFNPRYRRSNGVSVLCAQHHVTENFFLAMGDHLVSDDIMTGLPAHPPPDGGATLLVDHRLERVFDLEDATKVQQANGRIHRIGKKIDEFNCVDIGVFSATPGLFAALAAVLAEKGDASLSDGIQRLADAGRMRAAAVDGYWQDIDTPEMLAHAERQFAFFRYAN
ncbi:MAG: NTP transferase domain-containing protein [Desulfobacterales bacterium]|nr:NTP transferase domain-containing protein [Desulfobacterales bacterium]